MRDGVKAGLKRAISQCADVTEKTVEEWAHGRTVPSGFKIETVLCTLGAGDKFRARLGIEGDTPEARINRALAIIDEAKHDIAEYLPSSRECQQLVNQGGEVIRAAVGFIQAANSLRAEPEREVKPVRLVGPDRGGDAA